MELEVRAASAHPAERSGSSGENGGWTMVMSKLLGRTAGGPSSRKCPRPGITAASDRGRDRASPRACRCPRCTARSTPGAGRDRAARATRFRRWIAAFSPVERHRRGLLRRGPSSVSRLPSVLWIRHLFGTTETLYRSDISGSKVGSTPRKARISRNVCGGRRPSRRTGRPAALFAEHLVIAAQLFEVIPHGRGSATEVPSQPLSGLVRGEAAAKVGGLLATVAHHVGEGRVSTVDGLAEDGDQSSVRHAAASCGQLPRSYRDSASRPHRSRPGRLRRRTVRRSRRTS